MMGRFIIDGPSSRNHKFSDEHFDIFYVLKSLQKQPLMALKIWTLFFFKKIHFIALNYFCLML